MTDIRIRAKLNYFDEMDLRPLLLMSKPERFAARKELMMNFNLFSLLDFTIFLCTGTLKYYAFWVFYLQKGNDLQIRFFVMLVTIIKILHNLTFFRNKNNILNCMQPSFIYVMFMFEHNN